MRPTLQHLDLRLRVPRRSLRFILLACLLGLTVSRVGAQETDWPEWRGPQRDGVAGAVRLSRNWLDGDLKVRWRVPLAEGYATPLVVDNRVLTFGRE